MSPGYSSPTPYTIKYVKFDRCVARNRREKRLQARKYYKQREWDASTMQASECQCFIISRDLHDDRLNQAGPINDFDQGPFRDARNV